jgi:hypothetical protein
MWKRWLWHDLSDIRKLLEGRNFAESESFRAVVVERFMFMTAYIMRKLWERDELTVELVTSKWPAQEFKCIKPPPHPAWFRVSEDRQTWREPLEDHYLLDAPRETQLAFPDICNWIVHHFAFTVRSDADGEIEVLFNSDWTKREHLWMITLDTYMHVVEEACYDEVRWVSMDKYARGGKGRVKQYRNRPRGM